MSSFTEISLPVPGGENSVAQLVSADPLKMGHLSIPYGHLLKVLYIGMFVCAEAAFILMAIKEYIQDVLKLSDVEIILEMRKV